MSSDMTGLYNHLKAALFTAYGEALTRKRPSRKPSLKRAIRQAEQAGCGRVKAASVRPDGTIVLQFDYNLDDNHAPAIPSENEWDEVLKQ